MRITLCRAARQHQARRAQFQQGGDFVDLSGRDAGFLADARFVIALHRSRNIASSGPQGVDDAQRQNAFGSRTHHNPAIRIGAGQCHLRFHLDQHAALAIHALAKLRILLRKMHRRNPGAEEVGTEGQHHLGFIDVETRHFHAVRFFVGSAQHSRRNRFIREMILAAEAVQIIAQQHLEMAAHAAGQKSDFFAAHTVQLFGDQRVGIFPGDGFALPALAQQRLAHAVRIVVVLHACLPQAACPAAIDRGIGIAIQLQHAPFAYASGDITARITLRAGRIKIRADTGNHVVVRFNIRNYSFPAILD